jgi:hypothetical protein
VRRSGSTRNDYFPARATLRNSSGAAEFDLLLERVETPP